MQLALGQFNLPPTVQKTIRLLIGLSTFACQNAKESSANKTATPASETPSFNLGECGVEAESFDGSLKIVAEVEGRQFGPACVAGKIETERLGTTADGLAYNITCKSAASDERLSFWVKGFTANTPFSTQDTWKLLPNISLQLDTPAGQIKRDSFGPQPEHVVHLGGIVWIYDAPEVKAVPPFPEHRLKGCIEGKFTSSGSLKNGSIKVLFDIKAK